MIEFRRSTSGGNQGAYDVLYSNEGIHQLDSFYMWVLGLLKPVPGRTLLDISCGEGQLAYWAVKRGLAVHGIDISSEAIKIAKTRVQEAVLEVANGEEIPYPADSFDYVTNIGSLEHYEHMERGAREIARVMKPSAKACVFVPNMYGFFWQIRAVWRTGDLSDDGQPIQRYGTINEWRRLLESNGLRVEKVHNYEYEFPRTFRDFIMLLKRPRKMVYLLSSPFVPLNLSSNLTFICSKENK